MGALRWTTLTAAAEVGLTGLILIVSPSLFGWLVLGVELNEAAQALGRIAGFAMLGFGIASWPAGAAAGPTEQATRALLIYNVLATIYLGYLGVAAKPGVLLWPAVALHAAIAVTLARALFIREKR